MAVLEAPSHSNPPAIAPERSALRILLATAGDPDSMGAVHLASALAGDAGVEVMALGVATPFPHTLTPMFSVRQPVAIDEGSRLELLGRIQRVLDRLAGAERWAKRAVIGWPGDVINNAAESWKATMIVLGLGRHRRLDRLFGTETAITVFKHARTPVLAVTSGARGLPRHACAAIDFTKASLSSGAVAASVLAEDGKITLVHACAFKGVVSREGDLVDIYRTGARSKLQDAVATLRRHTRKQVDGVMIDGEPGDTILKYASDEGCDLIALGGHEQGLVDRILLGSVRTRVVRAAKCSVLITPPSDLPT